MELEVTVEIGRVYVNLLVPEGDEGVVGVDLVYLEDEDDDDDEEDEAEAEAVPGLSLILRQNPTRSLRQNPSQTIPRVKAEPEARTRGCGQP